MKKAVKFIQIETSSNHIYGLDREGNVWYRSLIPYTTTTYYQTTTPSRKETEAKENETLWKPLVMDGRVSDPPGTPLETVPIDKPADESANVNVAQETETITVPVEAPKQVVDERPTPSVVPAPAESGELIHLPSSISVREARALPENKPVYTGKGGWD